MGSSDSKVHFRKAVVQLASTTQPVEASDDVFWEQFWARPSTSIRDVFALVPAAEVRALREESPSNLATLCYKAVERLSLAAHAGCPSERERAAALNCARLLTRLLPFIYEDADWRGFFWAGPVAALKQHDGDDDWDGGRPLGQSLLLVVADLLFCPHLTVRGLGDGDGGGREAGAEAVDSCELIWEAGVGFAPSPALNSSHDSNRTELLKLLLTCFSEVLYLWPAQSQRNPWVLFFCSAANRHALPLFTSLLNVVCAYDPSGRGFPYGHLLFWDRRLVLVEQALQVLVVALEKPGPPEAQPEPDSDVRTASIPSVSRARSPETRVLTPFASVQSGQDRNQFVDFLSRIHREEDLSFVLRGVIRLLNNPLAQTYLPNSGRKIGFHRELLVLFWKICHFNKKFLFLVLKSSHVLDVVVPVLFFLHEARSDPAAVGLVHTGVAILLLLSGERNFGVRLNKPFTLRVPMDVPVFNGTHADLLVVIFHRMMTGGGHGRLRPLFDCLLTVVVNGERRRPPSSAVCLRRGRPTGVPEESRSTLTSLFLLVSPYLKSLSMVSSDKLLHLVEVFSQPRFLFSAPQNHQLVFFLLEAFNNMVQYQFDGNSNLVYSLIRQRNLFYRLANTPTDAASLGQALLRQEKKRRECEPAPTGPPSAIQTGRDIWEPPRTPDGGPGVGGVIGSESGRERERQDTPPESRAGSSSPWTATPDWALCWKSKLPLQTIMRLLQVLVPQVEKICIDKALTDEREILSFLRHGTLVGLLPVPHPILIRKSQVNGATASWFRTYAWGVVYLRHLDPAIWYDTDIRLFEIQKM
ncbi:protein HID1b isoform X1 [Stigmatopora nigra]